MSAELVKSLKKREKSAAKVAEAADRCLTVHWRGDRASWDIEVDAGAGAVWGAPLAAASATGLRDSLADFLTAVSALSSLDVGPRGLAGAPRAGKGKAKSQTAAERTKAETFRARKLSVSNLDAGGKGGDLNDVVDEVLSEDGDLYMAKEMVNGRGAAVNLADDGELPFEHTECGAFSCHGIEPKFSRQGFQVKAKINQDRGGVQYPFGGRRDMAFFCVMDGHGRGGEKISEYCMTHLPKYVLAHKELVGSPGKALRAAFLQVDADLRRVLAREATYAGTTCVVVLAIGNVLVIANAGDSRAVVGSVDPAAPGRVVAKDLSHDHKPDSPAETARVLSMGGFVSAESEEEGPSRVWLGRAMNSCGLAMARSLGDHALAAVGVIAEPEITTHVLTPNDRYLVLGSDGIWEFIGSQQAAEMVHTTMGKHGGGGGAGADKACRLLIEKSTIAWKVNEGDYRDDITGIVVALPCFQENDVIPMTPRTMSNVVGTKF